MTEHLRTAAAARRGEGGATLVEYALAVALIAVVSLGAISALEDSSSDRLDARGGTVGGAAEEVGVLPSGSGGGGSPPPPPPPPGPTTYDASVSNMAGTASQGSPDNKWIAQVVVHVVDSNDDPIEGITVSGDWAPATGQPGASCVTDSTGGCTVQLNDIKDADTTVTFTITGMSSTDPSITVNYSPPPDSYTVDCMAFPGSC